MRPILPSPDLIDDWKEWARRLIIVLRQLLISPFTANNCSFSNLSSGQVQVNSRSVSTTCLIFLMPQQMPLGIIYEDKTQRIAGKSFVIKSTDENDVLDVAWLIAEPA